MTVTKPNAYLFYLDGLRAIAILAVLAFHSDNTWLSGGFLGVEIFFVISGFIITKLLLDEWQKNGRLDLKRFWFRRLRRLIPAAFTMMLATWICVLLFFPDEINQIFDDLIYGITFTNNWNYIINERSYFDLIGRPRLFEHLWSLGIEFQFYVVWAVASIVLFRLPRWVACIVVLVFALVSSYFMATLYDPNSDPSRVYFGTDTRVSALFIGSLVAFLIRSPEIIILNKSKFQLLNFSALFGVIGLVLFCVYAKSSDAFLYQGGFLSVSILTAVVIGLCLIISQQNYFSFVLILLNNPVFRAIGVRAYGIYLWHWAIFGLTQPFVDVPLEGLSLLAFRMTLTFLFSEITFRFIEKPIRNGCIERALETVFKSTGGEQKKYIAYWTLAGAVSLAGCSGLMIATEQELSVAQQHVINESVEDVSPIIKTKPVKLDVERIIFNPELNSSLLEAVIENAVFIQDKAMITADAQGMVNGQNSTDMAIEQNDISVDVPQNNLQIDRNKNGKGYINRIRTIDDMGKKPAVFLLGDSVMVGATPELLKRLPKLSIDSQVGRQLSKGIQILTERKNNGVLSDTVIIHLGNNSPINANQMTALVNLLSDTKKIILINLKLPRNYESANNRLFSDMANKNKNVTVIDWRENSMNAKNIFGKDGIHLTANGAKLYAGLISEVLAVQK
jgi:peptidoglycan/LPS O-acetylase OafA/YrhL